MSALSPWLSLAIIFCSAVLLRQFAARYSLKKYFPSPPSGLLLGHIRAFTQGIPWVTLTNLQKDYGDILQLFVVRKSIIVLNKADDAHVLLEKRGANYSDRPRMFLHGEIGGIKYFTAFIQYGDDFRALRRLTMQYFDSREHVTMYPLLQAQLKILLKSLLESPKDFGEHLDRVSAGTILKSTYGCDTQAKEDAFSELAIEANSALTSLGLNGMTVVDLFPVLQYIPTWFPGVGIFDQAKKTRVLIDRMIEEPYEHVKARRKSGFEVTSMVDTLIEDYEKSGASDGKYEILIKNAAAQIYGAGAETSADLLHTFFFEMVHHPEVVRKAQTEIESVLGKDRLPTLNDRPDLPYIDCIVKEVMRINPAAPLGVPHAAIKEDTYKDKVIPAGSIVIANIWAMSRDEQYFPDPDTFNPDRFLPMVTNKNDVTHQLSSYRPDDPAALIFGFGRRICPGRFIADANTFLIIANVLTVFDIEPAIDSVTGKEILPEFDWKNGGLTAQLKPFKARIIPRSENHIQLINQD